MTTMMFPLRLVGAGLLASAASLAHATFTFSTLATSGNANTTATTYAASVGGARDSFSDLTINDPTPLGASLARTVSPGPFSYTVSTQSNLYSVQSPVIGGPALQAENNTDSLTFNGFAPGVYKFGASFYLSELSASNAVGGLMTVQATDVSGFSQNFTFTQGTSGGAASLYFTLASTAALQSVQLIAPAVGANPNVFATVDNAVIAPVPLPAAAWLLLSGIGGLGVFRRRRA